MSSPVEFVLTIQRDPGCPVGQYRLRTVRRRRWIDRIMAWIADGRVQVPELSNYPSGLSVGVRMTPAQYDCITGAHAHPDVAGHAVAELILTHDDPCTR